MPIKNLRKNALISSLVLCIFLCITTIISAQTTAVSEKPVTETIKDNPTAKPEIAEKPATEIKAPAPEPETPKESTTPETTKTKIPEIKAEPVAPAKTKDAKLSEEIRPVPENKTIPEQKEALTPAQEKAADRVENKPETGQKPVVSIPKDPEKPAVAAARKQVPYILGGWLKNTVFSFNFGLFSPISSYGTYYKDALLFGCGIELREFSVFGINPEIHFTHFTMSGKTIPNWPDSEMSVNQLLAGLSYYYDLPVPAAMSRIGMKPVAVFIRLTDGVSFTDFISDRTSAHVYERIQTFGVSGGLTYPVWRGMYLGAEAGYQVIYTAVNLLRSVSVMVKVEARI